MIVIDFDHGVMDCCDVEETSSYLSMQADFLSKPLQGELFEKQMKWLMGIE